MAAVPAPPYRWRQWKGLVQSHRLRLELQRLACSISWFAICAFAMAVVQIKGDTTHVRHVVEPLRATAAAARSSPLIAAAGDATAAILGVYDVVFENLPNVLAHRWFNPDLMLHSFLLVSGILAICHWSIPVFIRRLRRYFWLYGSGYLLRLLTLAFTVLPPSNVACVPVERSLGQTLLVAPKLLFGQVHSCTDKIFSGHTTVATLLLWFWLEARSGAGDRVFSFWRIYAVVHFVAMVTSSVLGRNHYTVDIVVSFVINSLTYWTYRLLLGMAMLGYTNGVSLKGLSEFKGMMRVVGWCEGIDLIENEQMLSTIEETIELSVVV